VSPALGVLDGEVARSVSDRLARTGRARVPDILAPDYANALLEAAGETGYATVSHSESRHLDMPAVWLASLEPERKARLGQAIQASAAERFSYLYDNHPIFDLHQAGEAGPVWGDLVDFLNGEAFLERMRSLTREPRIAMADAQLTRFRPGHFLTRHDDSAEGKHRYFAYVLNLSPRWNPDWGGLLAFLDEDGDVSEAFSPRFNTLNLLKVPAPHCVTQVALFAPVDRISVTGWLRGRP